MAKLSKAGTTILWQMEKTYPKDEGTNIERLAMRSDGRLLTKFICVRPGYRHDYGWKRAFKNAKSGAKEVLIARGWQLI